jgi:hypothetical protein
VFVTARAKNNFTFANKVSSLRQKFLTALSMLKATLLKLTRAAQNCINYALKIYPDPEVMAKTIQHSPHISKSSDKEDKNQPIVARPNSPKQDL